MEVAQTLLPDDCIIKSKEKLVIYKFTNRINAKEYVGKSKGYAGARIRGHLRAAKKGSGYLLHRAIRKHGIENFDAVIIDHARDVDDLDEKEIYWIKACDCIAPYGYNLCAGGGGLKDPSPETREKMRESARRAMTAERRKEQSERTRGKPSPNQPEHYQRLAARSRGIPRTREVRDKIAQATSGKKRTPEQCENIARAKLGKHPKRKRGYKLTEAHKAKIKAGSTHHKPSEAHKERLRQIRTGWNPSEATRQQMSESAKKRDHDGERRGRNSLVALRPLGDESLMGTTAVARWFGKTRSWLKQLAREHKIPTTLVDGKFKFNPVELEAWALSQGFKIAGENEFPMQLSLFGKK